MTIPDVITQYWLPILVYQLVAAFVAAYVARFRQRDQGYWFMLGLVAGVFAVGALFILPARPKELAPASNLLLDPEHYLRSGWRILLFIVTVMLVYFLLGTLARISGFVPYQSLFFLFYIDVAIATYLMLTIVDRRKFSSVGFPLHRRILKDVLLGISIGTVMIVLVVGVELVVGAVRLHVRPGLNFVFLLRNFGLSFIFFGYFALGEELLFRGYPFQALINGVGAVGATILMSIFFGIVHSANPNAGLLSTLNTMLAGAWLCIAYLKTRSLYFPFGMHFSWNLVQSFFLSLPVSGLLTNRTIFIPTDYGPDWLTGGKYGPEAGIGTTIVIVAAIAYFLLDKRIKPAYDYEASRARMEKVIQDRPA